MFDYRPHRETRETDGCLTFLLAGGQGSRLFELTEAECKPAIPFAEDTRIVDFVMNAAHRGGFDRMMVATQYQPATLQSHLSRNWAHVFDRGLSIHDGAAVTPQTGGYRGTADAVAANMAEIDRIAPREILVLAGDHVLDMDLAAMLSAHRVSGAPVTVAATPVARDAARGFGVLDADATGLATSFVEKPQNPPAMIGAPDKALASMGIYVLDWDWLRDALMTESAKPECRHDFGHDIMPRALSERGLNVYALPEGGAGNTGYWRDVGTLDSYRVTRLDFEGDDRPFDLPKLPRKSGSAAIAADGAELNESVTLPGARVGASCRLNRVILGADAVLPDGLVIGEDPQEDARWFRRTAEGTTLVTGAMLHRREEERARMRPAFGKPSLPSYPLH